MQENPKSWKDYSDLKFERADHAGNVLGARAFQFSEDLARIGAPVNKNRRLMTPSTVNAYYDPANNEFAITAGILQPPYFDLTMKGAFPPGLGFCALRMMARKPAVKHSGTSSTVLPFALRWAL